MPTREEVLKNKTFKEDYMELELRVLYTLMNAKSGDNTLIDDNFVRINRVAKTVASIIKLLKDKGLLKNEEIDEILLEAIN